MTTDDDQFPEGTAIPISVLGVKMKDIAEALKKALAEGVNGSCNIPVINSHDTKRQP